MRFGCVCPTYNRPHILGECIAFFLSFELRDGDSKFLLIVDDLGQYEDIGHIPGVIFDSFPERFPFLGDKRHYATQGAIDCGADVIVVIDDDDIYMPWTLLAHADAIEKTPVSQPRRAMSVLSEKFSRTVINENEHTYHGCMAFTADAYRKSGGYPIGVDSGEDKVIQRRLARVAKASDSTANRQPFFIQFWRSDVLHACSAGDAYQIAPSKPVVDTPLVVDGDAERRWTRLVQRYYLPHSVDPKTGVLTYA